MPRPIWTGAISFGLVRIPISLHRAVNPKNVQFHMVDTRTNSRIKQKRVSAADGTEVPQESLAKGYELPDGNIVVMADDELSALRAQATKTIELEQFVHLDEIDPIMFDTAYLVAPDEKAPKPYALLLRAMADAGQVGIGRLVLRTKEYVVALRPMGDHLALSTMVYADELADPSAIPGLQAVAEVELADRELAAARQLVESLAEPWEPAAYHDTHRQAVLELIEQKAQGAVPAASTATPATDGVVIDLMAALEDSIAAAAAARKRHPTAHEEGAEAAEDDEGATEAKKPAPRAAASTKAKTTASKSAAGSKPPTKKAPAKKAAPKPAAEARRRRAG